MAHLATAVLGLSAPHFSFAQNLLTISQTAPWPVIHQNLSMTKDAPFCAPQTNQLKVSLLEAKTTIVNLHGNRYLYSQVSKIQTTDILAFDPSDLTRPKFSYTLPGAYPDVGGGVIDSNQRIWWIAKSQLVRLSEELKEPVFSPKLPGKQYNGATLLPDGNMLVTSMPLYSVVSTTPEKRKNAVLPILMADGNLETLDFGPDHANPTIGAGFGPRPVTDGLGSFIFVLPKAVFKVSYDSASKKLGGPDGSKVDWVYWAPEAEEYGISDAVIVGKNICFNSVPIAGQKGIRVTCLEKQFGYPLGVAIAFPDSSSLLATWHTLGGWGENTLVAISDSTDGSGGMQAFDLSNPNGSGSFSSLWLKNLPSISEAFALSRVSGKAYISSRASPLAPYEVIAIDLDNGISEILLSSKDIAGMPGKALSLIGTLGNLYIPTSSGLLQIRDNDVSENCN